MGFFDGLFSLITAPFRAVGGLFQDIFQGKDVLNSFTTMGARLISTPMQAVSLVVNDLPGVSDLFHSDFFNTLTLGVAKDLTEAGKYATEINNFGLSTVPTPLEFKDRLLAPELTSAFKIGAGIITAGAASGVAAKSGLSTVETIGATTGGAYAGAGGARSLEVGIKTGDLSKIISGAANVSSNTDLGIVPQEVSDSVRTAQEYASEISKNVDQAKGIYAQANSLLDQSKSAQSQASQLVSRAKSAFPAQVSGYSSQPTSQTVVQAGIPIGLFLLLGGILLLSNKKGILA